MLELHIKTGNLLSFSSSKRMVIFRLTTNLMLFYEVINSCF